MKKRKIDIREIIKEFDLKICNTECEPIYRYVQEPAIKRLGLELSGQTENSYYSRNIICWGTSESIFFLKKGKEEALNILDRVLKVQPPLVILSKGVSELPKKWILKICNKYKIPVFVTEFSSTSRITASIGTYLSEKYSEEVQIHGCLVLIGGVGVLIVGPSGSGKSEATLELIQRGHIFVSDDAVLVKLVGNTYHGKSPAITKNFLEARGIGLIDIKYTYGIKSVTDNCEIDLVVELVSNRTEEAKDLDRLGLLNLKFPILDSALPKIQIPVKDGSSAASLIETAVSTFLARKDGIDVLKEIQERGEKDNEV
ncbi:HPr(Ser) kinase/phosphatase [Mycoplasmopsis caviae]|uniref:HPr kinase/phosphorylase n=1 Tax=Mycoplasmopsis caviae TaxID=55603 RepID=A0A3P8KLV9_9BACT|nr:HPr(Ser) kinase/phosphatase [Mycoplasmopsis caviae]UUD35475.1 HPr(Ser) kinase/phosphatase [Mycoplasmopsis caviae]VDR41748.1 HPr kinase/phosphorylase [Mycoplasmopsis caviae]